MKNLIVIIVLFPILIIYPQDSLLQIAPEDFVEDKVLTDDPGWDLLNTFEDTLYAGDLSEHTVCKINYDFNFDGIQDIALTDYYIWGAHIGQWSIFLGMGNKQYLYLDELWFNNNAVIFDSVSKGKSKVIVFEKAGGGIADIAEYFLSTDGIKGIKKTTYYPESEDMEEPYAKAYNEFNFQSLEKSCITASDYMKNKKLLWKKGD